MSHEIFWQGDIWDCRDKIGTFRLVALDHPTNGCFALQKYQVANNTIETAGYWSDVQVYKDDHFQSADLQTAGANAALLTLIIREILKRHFKDYRSVPKQA